MPPATAVHDRLISAPSFTLPDALRRGWPLTPGNVAEIGLGAAQALAAAHSAGFRYGPIDVSDVVFRSGGEAGLRARALIADDDSSVDAFEAAAAAEVAELVALLVALSEIATLQTAPDAGFLGGEKIGGESGGDSGGYLASLRAGGTDLPQAGTLAAELCARCAPDPLAEVQADGVPRSVSRRSGDADSYPTEPITPVFARLLDFAAGHLVAVAAMAVGVVVVGFFFHGASGIASPSAQLVTTGRSVAAQPDDRVTHNGLDTLAAPTEAGSPMSAAQSSALPSSVAPTASAVVKAAVDTPDREAGRQAKGPSALPSPPSQSGLARLPRATELVKDDPVAGALWLLQRQLDLISGVVSNPASVTMPGSTAAAEDQQVIDVRVAAGVRWPRQRARVRAAWPVVESVTPVAEPVETTRFPVVEPLPPVVEPVETTRFPVVEPVETTVTPTASVTVRYDIVPYWPPQRITNDLRLAHYGPLVTTLDLTWTTGGWRVQSMGM